MRKKFFINNFGLVCSSDFVFLASVFLGLLISCVGVFAAETENSDNNQENVARAELRKQLWVNAAILEKSGEVISQSAKYIAPTIVHIEVRRLRAATPTRGRDSRNVQIEVEDSGSGFIVQIDGKNYIITNQHVVGGVDLESIVVHTIDRRMLTPKQIYMNNEFDLAVIEMDAKLVPSDIGDSDRVRTGDLILTIGSPYGLERSVTMGIVSATSRRKIPASNGQAPSCEFFQIDAATNPGNSGGPVLNIKGEVVGIVTAIATTGGGSEGIAFAIPINSVLRIAKQIANGGVAQRPYIGVSYDHIFGTKEHKKIGLDRMIGAHISRVLPDSPASEANIQNGDIVIKLGNTEIEDGYHLNNLICQSEIGKQIELTVIRNKKNIKIKVTPTGKVSR
ncbi:MAG: trypsin-like peptidase domain-containing protein [Planctomycetaceae bacterium]|jgi:serine protease Do|nr:trypsin-like peptidase domain-containing protein [Planctomycetaceae bacterium]